MYRRDLGLTLASGVVLLSLLATIESFGALADPRAIAVGIGGGLLVEAAFLLGTRVVEWWQRPWVPPASTLAFVAATVTVAMLYGPVIVAAACWGLATYLVALAGTVALTVFGL